MVKMIDLLVIHPGAQHGIYGELGDILTAIEPPTWSRIVAGYFDNRGYNVQICDAEALQLSPEQVAQLTLSLQPLLTVIMVSGHQPSASTQQMTSAGLIATAIKQVWSGRVAMAGNHPSALPRRTLEEEDVDFVIDGEAIITIQDFLNERKVEDIPGLVWQTPQHIIENAHAPLIEDTSQLMGNAWNLLPMDKYRSHNWQAFGGWKRAPYASIYTTLGCPYKCSFCMINTFQHSNRYRRFDPQAVVYQIENLFSRYGVRMFKIADEMFILRESHYTAIAKGLIARGLGEHINIWAYARVDTINFDHLPLLRGAGFRWLALGIESGSEHVRDGANKKMRRGDIVDVVRGVQRAGINVIGNFMFGLPDDTYETMGQTLDLALACLPDFANFYCTMAYPGSQLFTQAEEELWTLPKTWRGYSQHNEDCRPLDTKFVEAKDVLRFRDWAFNSFYRHPPYQEMIGEKFGDDALEEIRRMLDYRIHRKLLTGEIK